MGLASHIVLPRKKGKFIDEILYDSLSAKTANRVCDSEHILALVRSSGTDTPFSKAIYGKHFFNENQNQSNGKAHKQDLDYVESLYKTVKDFLDFSRHSRHDRNDPALRMTFSARLDNAGRSVEAHNAHLHLFYEHRVASLERYIAFCVMFHAMAKDCKVPWLCTGWNTARSQSNLRVATTGWLYAPVVYRYCNTTITQCSSIFFTSQLINIPSHLYYTTIQNSSQPRLSLPRREVQLQLDSCWRECESEIPISECLRFASESICPP